MHSTTMTDSAEGDLECFPSAHDLNWTDLRLTSLGVHWWTRRLGSSRFFVGPGVVGVCLVRKRREKRSKRNETSPLPIDVAMPGPWTDRGGRWCYGRARRTATQ